ncbi:hypothetical protein L535_1309, partial [Bordetella bronchiseptica SBL-F6116]
MVNPAQARDFAKALAMRSNVSWAYPKPGAFMSDTATA